MIRRIKKKLMENDDIKKVIYIYRTTIEIAIDIIENDLYFYEGRRKKIGRGKKYLPVGTDSGPPKLLGK